MNIRESMAHVIGADPFVLLDELEHAGKRKARADGLSYQMMEMRKSVLSSIVTELVREHPNAAISKLEHMARADSRYTNHIAGTAAALEEKELATVAYFRVKGEIEWCAHANYTANATAKLQR